ncbi:MAG TPA: DUF6544 family protein [Nocardioidaceae bacterium]|nr:DUF6544 family protein [Nocardioidaceae bacterium]
MTSAARWLVVALLGVHGLIHLLGAAKGLGLARVARLQEPLGPMMGALWMLAALAVLAVTAMIALGPPSWWWLAAVAAAVLSQALVFTSWNDAKAGTVVNVVLVLAAVVGFAGSGPGSYEARWQQRVDAAVAAAPAPTGVVTEADLDGVPAPLARYLRRVGAVGRPRVTEFYAVLHGRIRSGPGSPWMPFTARQLNTFGPRPQRLFLLHATRSGLPVTVFHDYHDGTATMGGKVLSLVPILDASGPEMDQGETVTVLNDMAVFAPAALIDARITWEQLDGRRVRGTFVNGSQTVDAELVFDASGDLVDFVSDDRFAASPDGSTFTPQRWSTPLSEYTQLAERRVAAAGEGRWHRSQPDGSFTYIELRLDDITYNDGVPQDGGQAVAHAQRP